MATKVNNWTPLSGNYTMYDESSYSEEAYLPNKPDVSAPASYIGAPNVNWIDSGTSFATPVVTCIVAQMMSENSQLKNKPLVVKAALLLGADHSRMDVTNDTWKGIDIRDKSGTGLLDARYALNRIISSTKISIDLDVNSQTERYYFEAGTRVKAIMVFNKNNDAMITSQSDLDDLDFRLKKESGVYYSGSQSSVNNVEIIDTTINESGYYYFDVNPYRIVDSENKPDVAIAFRVFE